MPTLATVPLSSPKSTLTMSPVRILAAAISMWEAREAARAGAPSVSACTLEQSIASATSSKRSMGRGERGEGGGRGRAGRGGKR